MKKTFFAGPFVGEFGHELFCWQGKLRLIAKEYKETIISCLPGHEILYEDFADEIITYKPEVFEPDCSWNRGITKDYPMPGKTDKYIGPNKQIIQLYDPVQEFVKLGSGKGESFDFILSARMTNKCKTGYRDWSTENWDALVRRLNSDGYSVACIGKDNMSYRIPGTTDLFDMALSDLAEIVSASSVMVGGSSGPMHFGALCGIKEVVWSGDNIKTNKVRYMDWWNPFKVEVGFIPSTNWNPTVDEVYLECKKI